MTQRERNALDRYITGNYGEDQIRDLVYVPNAGNLPKCGLCPICGESIHLTGQLSTDGRIIGSCGDAFTTARWLEE